MFIQLLKWQKMFRSLLITCALCINILSGAQQITPVDLPDPNIPGFTFPTSEDVIIEWTETNNQTEMIKHAWGVWTVLTMETNQIYEGQNLRVFETWESPSDFMSEGILTPRPFDVPHQFLHAGSHLLSTQGEETVTAFVKYDPTAAKHIKENNLFSQQSLQKLLDEGKSKVPDFPNTSISLKPVFQKHSASDLVDDRYIQMPAWPGPGTPLPGPDTPFGSDDWNQCIWIDIQNQGNGDGSVDTKCAKDGSSRTPATTYNLKSFIHFRLAKHEAALANAALAKQWEQKARSAKLKSEAVPAVPKTMVEGDYAILAAMHITTREITRWTWQTMWWEQNPENPQFPSSKLTASLRPKQLKDAPAHYALTHSFSMKIPPQPNTGGKNVGNSVYAYNPWLEAGFGPSDLPDSISGIYENRSVPNNVGMQTNCMSCHGFANFNPEKLKTAPGYTGNRYIDLEDPAFKGTLQVDFLWSIPGNVK